MHTDAMVSIANPANYRRFWGPQMFLWPTAAKIPHCCGLDLTDSTWLLVKSQYAPLNPKF
jgi:hypothetical protein